MENGPSGLDFNLLPNKLIDSSNPYLQILSCLPESENREQEIVMVYLEQDAFAPLSWKTTVKVLYCAVLYCTAAVYSSSDNSNNNKLNLKFWNIVGSTDLKEPYTNSI